MHSSWFSRSGLLLDWSSILIRTCVPPYEECPQEESPTSYVCLTAGWAGSGYNCLSCERFGSPVEIGECCRLETDGCYWFDCLLLLLPGSCSFRSDSCSRLLLVPPGMGLALGSWP